MINYRLYDLYEGKELIGEYTTVTECKRAMHQYDLDTDYENCMYVERLSYVDGKFHEFQLTY